ncbi:MAG TPA: NlpC/P60 family protein [Chthoniobacteraceae bacterium]|jgi:cell wall-associated NlpC family hydrolase|nr:NlpC/P60 family protein [Chthoniobacteraceae bacterium]
MALTSEQQKNVLTVARAWLGTRYESGGDSKAGIDCSHLVHQAFSSAGLLYTYKQVDDFPILTQFEKVDDATPQPGDVLLFDGKPDAQGKKLPHMGIWDPGGCQMLSGTDPKAAECVLRKGDAPLLSARRKGTDYGRATENWFGRLRGTYRWKGPGK